MNQRILALALCAMLFAPCASAHAQQQKKVSRIGYLTARNPTAESARAAAIRLALREHSYMEGQNIVFEYRYAEGKLDRLPMLATELVRLKVDIIIVTGGNPDIRAAKNATTTIPIVMVGSGTDPVEAGFIDSLARPGGNVTGLTNLGPEMSDKRLELFKEAVPKLRRVAVLYDPALPSGVLQVKEVLPVAARALRLTLQPWEIGAADAFERVFAAMRKERPDGLFVTGGPVLNGNPKRTVDFALNSRLPSVYQSREAVEAGGLMSYTDNLVDLTGASLITWTEFSREPSLATCRWSNQRNSSW